MTNEKWPMTNNKFWCLIARTICHLSFVISHLSLNSRYLTLPVLQVLLCLLIPAAAWGAEAGEEKWGVLLTLGRFFNLAVVAGILMWVARKPLASFLVSRTQSIQEQLSEAQKVRREAEAKLAEIQSRMNRLDEELRALKEAAEREAQEEYRRLIAEAERDAEKIVERARREIDGMTRAAQIELKAHVAELSIRVAEENIRSEITEEDRGRIFTRFVTRLGGKKG
jgi:F-type H+-transporting ATPase subunit b